jgi:Fe-S-cluster containining protein
VPDPVALQIARWGGSFSAFYGSLERSLAPGTAGGCRRCGECCRRPCDTTPLDLAGILRLRALPWPAAFDRLFIALPVVAGRWEPLPVLMPVPAPRALAGGARGWIAAASAASEIAAGDAGHCVLFDPAPPACTIHPARPLGARVLSCPATAAGGRGISLERQVYYDAWRRNQAVLDAARPGYLGLFLRMEGEAAAYHRRVLAGGSPGGEHLAEAAGRIGEILRDEVFPLFGVSAAETPVVWDRDGMRSFPDAVSGTARGQGGVR